MPKFRVTKTSFINNTIVQEGEIVEYEGDISDNLEPVDAAGKKAQAASADANIESLVRQQAAATAGDANAAPDVAVAAAVTAAASEAAQGAQLV